MDKSGYADATKNFFAVMAENGRLGDIESVMDAFANIQRAAKGEVFAEITVADELTAPQKKATSAVSLRFTPIYPRFTLYLPLFTLDLPSIYPRFTLYFPRFTSNCLSICSR